MHDDTQVVRVQQMYKALRDGRFPVRWVPDLGYGYGYPIFNFYNPLAYYFGASGMFLGFNVITATKLMFVIPIIGSLFSMYLLSRLAFSRWAALLSGVLYLYAPYHGVQIYVRGSVAEYWAYAVLPLIFWAILKHRVVVGGIICAGLILSHNLTAFISIPFIVMIMAFQLFQSAHKRSLFAAFCLLFMIGLGLSAFFWIPATAEAPKTRVAEMVFQEFDPPVLHLISPLQLWTSSWGYGGSSPKLDDGLSFQIGKIHVIGSIAAISILLYCSISKKKLIMQQSSNMTIFYLFGLLLSLFFVLPFSAPIWNAFSILSYIQFPWRFLAFSSLFSSLLTAFVVESFVEKLSLHKIFGPLFIVFCILFIAYSFKFFQPQFKFPTTSEEQTSKEKILWEVSRRSDEYLPLGFERPKSLEEALRGGNKKNQALVDSLKRQTTIRVVGNMMSLVSVGGLLLYSIQPKRKLWITK